MRYRGKLDESDPRVAEALQNVRDSAMKLVEASREVMQAGVGDDEHARTEGCISVALKAVCNAFFIKEHNLDALMVGFTTTLGTIMANTLEPDGDDDALQYVTQGALQIAQGERELNVAGRAGLKH